ncbi:hypothetical protein AB0M28_13500 [Streptomyces sp. NPDC051940]|uniref:hypothetical protein n=1 Tax=Streptomyces sp. NPDC051940 TaxID=3155675 RepID=UPI003430CBD2
MSGRPVTDETFEQVRWLHAQGLSRNEIARQLERSGRTVSIISAKLGLTYDRSATEEATRARMADLAERRAILAEELHTDAERLSARMWQPAKVFAFGGKDNTYAEEYIDEPPADAKKSLMAAAGIAIDRSLKLCPPQDDGGAEAAKSMVGQMLTGLTAVYCEQKAAQQAAEEQPADEGDGDAP